MAIIPKTLKELQKRIRNDLLISANAGQLDISKQVDPNLKNSFLGSIADANAAGFDELNDLILEVIKQIFPQTATEEYLEYWANWVGIIRNPATKANGYVVFQGTVGTPIPSLTSIQNSAASYKTQTGVTITNSVISVTNISRSGSTVTATTSSNHYLFTGCKVTILGADQSDYNIVNQAVSVNASNQFQFEITATPTTPATGTITCSFNTARTQIIADDYGSASNSSGSSIFSLISPLAGVDLIAADFDGIAGGSDLESDDDLRARTNERYANLKSPFASKSLEIFLKNKISYIDRVWVYDATPNPGYVTIYFTANGKIPNSSQINQAKAELIDPDNQLKPANTPDSYILVLAPTALVIDFEISSLSPSTIEMRNAITQSLQGLFNSLTLGEDLTLDRINSVIYSSIDDSGNNPIFTLISPSSNISVADGELPILGDITWS